jgi:hypothetical protein
MLVVLLLTSATDAALETASLTVMSTVKLFLLLLLVAWTFWSSIGIWRSAQKHPARGGSRGWALIAQIMVCLCLLSFAGSLPTTILPQLKEYTLIVAGRDPLGRVDAKVSTNGRALILHGALGAGSAAEVRRLLEAAPGVRIVMLDSPGGRIKEAEDLAALVSANGLDTYVEGHCESACTYVFLAGRDRAATPTANIGFHSPTFPGLDESAKRALLSRMQAVYREAGISQGFLDKIAATPAESMWYPNRKELIDNGVINRMSLGGEVASLTTRIAISKADMARAFREIPLAAAIERRFPGTIDQMADALSRGRETGATDAELLSAVRQMIASHVPRLLAAANDEQLQEFFELTHAQLRAARTVSYEACRMVLASQLDITKALPPEHVEREMRWLMNVLDRPLAPAPPVNATRLDSVLESVFETISPEHVDILAHPATPNTDPSLQCDATIALYDALGDLPARDRSIALRGFFGAGE